VFFQQPALPRSSLAVFFICVAKWVLDQSQTQRVEEEKEEEEEEGYILSVPEWNTK